MRKIIASRILNKPLFLIAFISISTCLYAQPDDKTNTGSWLAGQNEKTQFC